MLCALQMFIGNTYEIHLIATLYLNIIFLSIQEAMAYVKHALSHAFHFREHRSHRSLVSYHLP